MKVRVATAPVNWGVLLRDTPGVPRWDMVLDQMVAAGYAGTELGPYGFLPLDPAVLTAELERRGLELLSAFVPVNLVDPQSRGTEYDEALEVAAFLSALECRYLVLSDALFADTRRAARAGRIGPWDGLDQDRWRSFTRNAAMMARMLRDDYGLEAVYHPHCGAWVEAPGEVDRLLADTGEELGLCLDTGHATYGGDDPVALLRRWGSRVRYLHLKDCDHEVLAGVRAREWDYFAAVEAGVFPELGRGSVDFPAFFAELERQGYDGWAVVEQDVLPGGDTDPAASARRNREFLTRLGIG